MAGGWGWVETGGDGVVAMGRRVLGRGGEGVLSWEMSVVP
jgi:hypothetical protein